jgi:hypothetical protein
MVDVFAPFARDARSNVVLDIIPDSDPSVFLSDECKGLVLAPVSRKVMVVFIEQNPKSEIINVRNIYPAVMIEETVAGFPSGVRGIVEVGLSNRIGW